MGVVVLKHRSDRPPTKDEIVGLLVGEENMGDKAKAKEALINILAPMKDLLALYKFIDTVEATAEQYAAMLVEQEALALEVTNVTAAADSAKVAFDAAKKTQREALAKVTADAAAKTALLAEQLAELEQKKLALVKEIDDEEKTRLRINKVVSDEYDRLRSAMLATVSSDEAEAKKNLVSIKQDVEKAKAELSAMAERKRQFIASLGG